MSVRAINWAMTTLQFCGLGPAERVTLIALAYHHTDKTGQCFPSGETLSSFTGLGERRQRQALRELEAWGLIKTQRRGRPGAPASNFYTLFGRLKAPRQTGTRLPVQTGTKKPVITGTGLPVSNRQTCAAERVTNLEAGPGQEIECCEVVPLTRRQRQ